MDIFDSRYYKINKFLLTCHGLWSFQSYRKKLLARSFIYFSLVSTLCLQFRFLFVVWGNDIRATLECLPPLTLIIMCFCQITVYNLNQEKLVLLVKCIKSDWKLWSSGLELEILRSYAESGRNYTLLYAAYLYGTVITFVTASLIPIVLNIIIPLNETRPKQLVYAVNFPFDHDQYIDWILVHGGVTAFINLSVMVSNEAMVAVCAQHACALFAIISHRLRNALEKTDSIILNLEKPKKDLLYEEMSFCIQYHNYAIRYSQTLESFCSPFLLLTIGGNIITNSVVMMQTLNSLGNIIPTIKFGTFSIAIIFNTYVLSLPGQNLIDHSFDVANEAFEACWYDIPIKSKKLLIMITMQTYRPCKLTIGKICGLDMVSFCKILKASVSYFTVLSSIR